MLDFRSVRSCKVGVRLRIYCSCWPCYQSIADLTDWIEPDSIKKIIEKIGALVLILGLAGDLISVGMAQIEAANLTREADDAKMSAEHAAKAAARANEYANGIARLSWPRQLDASKFVALLNGKPKARVKLLYNPNDSEAWSFARDLYWWLGNGIGDHKGAGWIVFPPKPISRTDASKGLSSPNAPIGMQLSGAYTGIGLTLRLRNTGTPSIPPLPASACGSVPLSRNCLFFAETGLTEAILMSVLPDERGGASTTEYDDSMPSDLIVLIVGPKPPIWHLDKPKNK